MAYKQIKKQYAYGVNGDNLLIPPQPIIAKRDPSTADQAELGTTWVNTIANSVWVLSSITANSSNWTTSPASGVGAFTNVTVTPGDVDVAIGDINITLGNLNVAAGNAVIGGDLTVQGTLAFNGDLDLNSAALIDMTSTLDAAPSILLHANGGTTEQIYLHADQGTAVNSILLASDVGGLTLSSGLASADAINLTASAGGIDMDGALQVNIASSQAAAGAVTVIASAGGITMTAAGGAAKDFNITNTAGSVNITSGEVIANSMVLTSAGGLDFTIAGTGGLDIDMANTSGSINITAGQAVADAIVVDATDAAGGVQIKAGSNGILIGCEADTAVISAGDFVPTSARTITIGGGAVATAIADTIDIAPDGATTDAGASKVLTLNSGNVDTGTLTVSLATGTAASGTHTVDIGTGTGGGTKRVNVGNVDGLTALTFYGSTAINNNVNQDTSINIGTSTGNVYIGNAAAGDITADSAAGISLDSATASNFTVTGVADLTLASVGGSVVIDGSEAAIDAIQLTASDVAGGLDLNSGTGGITVDTTGVFSIDGADASNVTVTGAAKDLTLASVGGSVVIDGSEAVVNAINLTASDVAGGLDFNAGTGGATLDTTGSFSIDGATASNVTVTGAGADLTLASVGGSVVVDGSQAAVDAITLNASDVAGGLDINTGTGGVTIDTTAAFSVDGATASNVTVTGAAQDLTLSSSGGSVNVTASEVAADAIKLNATGVNGGIELWTNVAGTGKIALRSNGYLTTEAGTATDATGPGATAAVAIATNVGVATCSGFTTAAAATLVLTVTNASVTATSAIMVSCSNVGANDSQMTVTRVKPAAGSFAVTLTNSGAAALNGDCIVTYWIISY